MKPKRSLTPEFKFQLVLETLKGEKSQTEIAREYDVHPRTKIQSLPVMNMPAPYLMMELP